jgi:predicted nucleic acid-binding protein
MSGDRFFVDTNVLLYEYDEGDLRKRDRAREWMNWLWQNASGVVSWQVLQEFYWNAVRKLAVPTDQARQAVILFAQWHPPDVTLVLFERAWFWTDNAQITFWDGMIVAAAERAGCRWLLTEDLQPGRVFAATTVLSPFDKAPEELL